ADAARDLAGEPGHRTATAVIEDEDLCHGTSVPLLPCADGAAGLDQPLERPPARPCPGPILLLLPVAPFPRRPPVRIRRRAGLHHGVRAGPAVDGGVRRA